MNRLVKLNRLNTSVLFNAAVKRTFSNTHPVSAGYIKDYKPGPYPKTEAERVAAAKKYNLK